jgi:hypothetical protein
MGGRAFTLRLSVGQRARVQQSVSAVSPVTAQRTLLAVQRSTADLSDGPLDGGQRSSGNELQPEDRQPRLNAVFQSASEPR